MKNRTRKEKHVELEKWMKDSEPKLGIKSIKLIRYVTGRSKDLEQCEAHAVFIRWFDDLVGQGHPVEVPIKQ